MLLVSLGTWLCSAPWTNFVPPSWVPPPPQGFPGLALQPVFCTRVCPLPGGLALRDDAEIGCLFLVPFSSSLPRQVRGLESCVMWSSPTRGCSFSLHAGPSVRGRTEVAQGPNPGTWDPMQPRAVAAARRLSNAGLVRWWKWKRAFPANHGREGRFCVLHMSFSSTCSQMVQSLLFFRRCASVNWSSVVCF